MVGAEGDVRSPSYGQRQPRVSRSSAKRSQFGGCRSDLVAVKPVIVGQLALGLRGGIDHIDCPLACIVLDRWRDTQRRVGQVGAVEDKPLIPLEL
jgi:hypothetical protein